MKSGSKKKKVLSYFSSALMQSIHSQPQLSPTVYEKYKSMVVFQETMHHIMIKARNIPNWYSLPYMVTEPEVDQVVTSWPKSWKIGLGSTKPVTPSTFGKDTTPKETTSKDIAPYPQDTMPTYTTEWHTETGGNDQEAIKDLDTDDDEGKNIDQELGGEHAEVDPGGLDGLGGDGVESSRDIKRKGETSKEPRNKRKGPRWADKRRLL